MGANQDAHSANTAEMRATDGTHIEYSGRAWSAAFGKNVQIDGSFVALDAVDSTERGTSLLVVPVKAYAAGAWFESDEYLICDGDLEDWRCLNCIGRAVKVVDANGHALGCPAYSQPTFTKCTCGAAERAGL